jgi:hypothetical protein
MRLRLLIALSCVILLLACRLHAQDAGFGGGGFGGGNFGGPAPLGAASGGAISPRFFGPINQGYGSYGFGTFGPGYYGPGVSGLHVGPPSAMSIDPSLRFHTYPGHAPSYVYPLRSNSGLPSIHDPLRTLPVTWPSRGKIAIHLSAEATTDITYTLNGTEYTIKPGYAQNFDDDRKWIISYADSESKKPIRYTLTAGAYRFLQNKVGFSLHEEIEKSATASVEPKTPE